MDSSSVPMPSAISLTSTDFSALAPYASYQGVRTNTPSTFSFQEALRPLVTPQQDYDQSWRQALNYNPAYLFRDACPSNGTQNCTVSCGNASQTFRSLTTFHNCASYPLIAQLYEEGNISTTTSDGTTVDSLGFLKGKKGSSVLTDITETLTKCLTSYCTTPECQEAVRDGSPTVFNSSDAFFSGFVNASGYDGGNNAYSYSYDFANYICELQLAGLNPDVGGIGVFISYWIQSGLALLGSFCVIWWGWGIYYLCFVTQSLRQGHKAGREYAKKMSAKYGNRRLPGAIAALIEFQKAQCFFMLAINIAAQVSKHRGDNNPTSLQQLYNNNGLIRAISVSGYLPVTFNLLTLHIVGMLSWYLIILSLLTVTFSVATTVDIGTFAPSPADMEYLATQSLINGTADCGNKNLLVYCLTPPTYYSESYYSYNSTDGSITGGYSTMAFCIVVLVLLILDQTALIKRMGNHAKTYKFFNDEFMNLRGVQLLLSILLWAASIMWTFNLMFAGCTQFSLLYIYLTSNLSYEPRKNWAGKLFNKWAVLAADISSWAVALTCLFTYPLQMRNDHDGALNPMPDLGTALSALLWLTFSLTTILTATHIHGTRKNRPKQHQLPSQYSASRRRLERLLSPARRLFQPITFVIKSEAVMTRVKRFKRNMKTLIGPDELSTMFKEFTICLLYIMFHALYVYWFVVYAQYLGNYYINVDTNSWSFGQVVAITVWAQPLCEYFHLEIRGMTRGFQHRLMWPYKVVRQDEDIETGFPQRSPSRPPPPPSPADGADQPKRASYEMVTRESSQAAPYTPHLVEEDVSAVKRDSLNKDPGRMNMSDGLEVNSILNQGRSHEYGRPRSGSDFSWEQGQGQELELELEHAAPRRSYLRIPEPEAEETDSFPPVQQRIQEQGDIRRQDNEHESYWRIPESVLLKSNDLRLE